MAKRIVCVVFGHKWRRHEETASAAYWQCARCGKVDRASGGSATGYADPPRGPYVSHEP